MLTDFKVYLNHNDMIATVTNNMQGTQKLDHKGLQLTFRKKTETDTHRSVVYALYPENIEITWELAIPVPGNTQRSKAAISGNTCNGGFIEQAVVDAFRRYLESNRQ